jgi:hypothetical protein
MLLSAAIMPPDGVRDELQVLVRDIGGRVRGFHPAPPADFRLDLARFGNVTPPDAARVADAIATAMRNVEARPAVRFSRVEVERPGEVSVGLSGDVDELLALVRAVPKSVEPLGLYVDRRRFRAGLVLGHVLDGGGTDRRADLDALWDWSGTAWPVPGVSVLHTRWVGGVGVDAGTELPWPAAERDETPARTEPPGRPVPVPRDT